MTTPHVDRRRRLMEQLPEGVTIVRGDAGGGRVNPNFRYLTGLGEPKAALLLAPGGLRIGFGRRHPGPDYQRGRIVRQALFLPPADPLLSRWGEDGVATLGSVDPAGAGVDAILGTGELADVLSEALPAAGVLHVVRSAAPALGGAVDDDAAFADEVRRRFFGIAVRDATAAVHEMRRLKDDAEVAAMRRSIAVTREALLRAWSKVRAGMLEYELEAEITHVYRSAGGGHAFDPIIASGPNACLMHYSANDREIGEGELVLFDTGASVGGYNADVTRTVPVGGRFTDRQREIYETVLRALEAATAACGPGVGLGEVHARAFEVIADAGYGGYFVHGTSHHLGMETHDVGDRFAPLAPGAIVTVEPGIYLPDEAIGVRIEDDVLVTGDGREVLTAAIPKTVADVERAFGLSR